MLLRRYNYEKFVTSKAARNEAITVTIMLLLGKRDKITATKPPITPTKGELLTKTIPGITKAVSAATGTNFKPVNA